MNDASYDLFEKFVDEHADSRVIAISHHIEFLIDAILKLELKEVNGDLRQHMKNFEFCNSILPHSLWVVHDADKLLRGEPNWLEQSVKNYHSAVKNASEDSDKTELRCEARWKDEKADIAKRLGYPGLEPWAAADKVLEELKSLRASARQEDSQQEHSEIMREITGHNL